MISNNSFRRILQATATGRRLHEVLAKAYYASPFANWRLQQHGCRALESVVAAKNKSGMLIWADFGTLLGAVREKGFIKSDFDLDCGAVDFDKDQVVRFCSCLTSQGMTFRYAYAFDMKLTELSFKYMGLSLDVFMYRRTDRGLYCVSMDSVIDSSGPVRVAGGTYVIPAVSSLVPMNIGRVRITVPENHLDVLVSEYGAAWRKPDPNWKANAYSVPRLIGSRRVAGLRLDSLEAALEFVD